VKARANTGSAQRASAESVVLRFKAGKCESEPRPNGKIWIKPLNRKGEVQLVRQDELLHFQWRDRTTLAVDPSCDHMIFPGDAKFEKMETGREGDRCYVLQFQAQENRRFFFWMQQKDDGDDETNVKKMNDFMNGNDSTHLAPATVTSTVAESSSSSGAMQNQSSAPAQLTLESLQSVMQNLGMPPAPSSPSPMLRLSDVADANAILTSGILQEPATMERLLPHLPEGQRTTAELEAVIRSPQFRQALDQLARALSSPENFGSILSSFRLAPNPNAPTLDPVRAFLDALTHTAAAASTPDQEDEEMVDAPPYPPAQSNEDDKKEG